MISAFQEIVSYNGDEWEDYLGKLCIYDIFKDFINLFKDKEILRQAIRYVVYAYSKDSKAIVLGDDWLANKKRIFESTLLPDTYFEDLVLLQNRIVVKTIEKWVEFQDNKTYCNLVSLSDLMVEMRLSSNSKIIKSSGETDFDQKFKNAQYVQELQKMIDDLEQELMQNDTKLKEAVREVKTAKSKNTIGVETFAN